MGREVNSTTLSPCAKMWNMMMTVLTLGCLRKKEEIRPVTNVWIDGHLVSALMDTGSEVSAISWTKFCKMQTGKKLMMPATKLIAANGSNMEIMGHALFDIKMGKIKAMRPMLVVKGLNQECIIGADTMINEGITLDFERKKLICGKRAHSDAWRARTVKEYNVSPGQEMMLRCHAAGLMVNRDVSVLELAGHEEINITPCVQTVKEADHISVPAVNPGMNPLHIPRGTEVAMIEDFATQKHFNVTRLCELHVHNRSSVNSSSITEEHVDLSGIPQMHRSGYLRVLNNFSDVFSKDVDDIGRCKIVKHKLILKDENKVANVPQYPIPYHLKHVAIAYVNKLLAAGIIRHSKSPFNAPLLLVRKPGVKAHDANLDIAAQIRNFRVVHDYRMLNANLVNDSYPLLNLHQLIDEVSSKKIWSVIDLSSGFWQQELTEESKKYTAFGISGVGHFEYQVSPQGISTSTSNFQRLLDHVCKGLKSTFTYVDDAIVATHTHEEMMPSPEIVSLL